MSTPRDALGQAVDRLAGELETPSRQIPDLLVEPARIGAVRGEVEQAR